MPIHLVAIAIDMLLNDRSSLGLEPLAAIEDRVIPFDKLFQPEVLLPPVSHPQRRINAHEQEERPLIESDLHVRECAEVEGDQLFTPMCCCVIEKGAGTVKAEWLGGGRGGGGGGWVRDAM